MNCDIDRIQSSPLPLVTVAYKTINVVNLLIIIYLLIKHFEQMQ